MPETRSVLPSLLVLACLGAGGFFACSDESSATPTEGDGSVAPAADATEPPPVDDGGTSTDPDAAGPITADFEVSGSRLRARRFEADGLSLFLGWHDDVEDLDCTKSLLDGRPVCAPRFQITSRVVYPTNGCDPAQRLVAPPSTSVLCGREPAFPALQSPSPEADAGPITTLHRIGAVAAIDPCFGGTACTPENTLFCAQVAPLGAPITTVGAQLSRQGAARIRTYDDGARELDAVLVGESPCDVYPASDGTLRCFVAQSAAAPLYLAADCTDAVVENGGVHDARIAFDETLACGATQRRLYLAGDTVRSDGGISSPVYRRDAAGACVSAGSRPNGLLVRVGEEIPVAVLPQATLVEHGAGRLRARYHVIAGIERFVSWFDSELGVSCSFERVRTDELRCVPNERVARQPASEDRLVYADAQCTALQRLVPKPAASECGETLFYATSLPGGCQGTGALARLQPPAAAFEMRDGVCTPATVDVAAYVALLPVDKDSLVLGREQRQ